MARGPVYARGHAGLSVAARGPVYARGHTGLLVAARGPVYARGHTGLSVAARGRGQPGHVPLLKRGCVRRSKCAKINGVNAKIKRRAAVKRQY